MKTQAYTQDKYSQSRQRRHTLKTSTLNHDNTQFNSTRPKVAKYNKSKDFFILKADAFKKRQASQIIETNLKPSTVNLTIKNKTKPSN